MYHRMAFRLLLRRWIIPFRIKPAFWLPCTVYALVCFCTRSTHTSDIPLTPGGEISLSADERQWLAKHDGRIRIGVTVIPPQVLRTEKGYEGLSIDYIRLLERLLGFRTLLVPFTTWNEVISAAKERRIDMIFAAQQTPERQHYLLFTEPYIELPNIIIVRNRYGAKDLKVMQGWSVAASEGSAVHEYLKKEYPDLVLNPVSDELSGLKQVSMGEVDAMVVEISRASYYIEKEGIMNLRVAGEAGLMYQLRFAVRNDWLQFREILDKALAAITPAQRQEISRRWIIVGENSVSVWRIFWVSLAAVAAAMTLAGAIFFGWTRALRKMVRHRTAQLQKELEERNRAEHALRHERTLLSRITETSPVGIVMVNREGLITFANLRAERLLGLSKSEITRRTFNAQQWHITDFNGKVFPEERLPFSLVMTDRKPVFDARHAIEWPDGRRVFLSINGAPVQDGAGEIESVVLTVEDITDRIRADNERLMYLHFLESMDRINRVIQSSKNLNQMMSEVLDVVLSLFACDRASLVYPCDPDAPSWSAPMERTRPEWPGALTLGLVVPMDTEVARIFRLSRTANGPVAFGPGSVERLPYKIAARFNIQSQMTMTLYPKIGKPWNFVMHQCSHPRVWTREEKRLLGEIGRRLADGLTSMLLQCDVSESNDRYRMVFENSPISIWEEDLSGVKSIFNDLKAAGVVDIEACFVKRPEIVHRCVDSVKIVDVNKAALAMLGAAKKEELITGLVNTFTPESFDMFRQELVCLWNGGTTMTGDTIVKTLGGESRNVTVSFSVCPGYENTLSKIFVTLVDITDRKRVEDALRKSDAALREAQRIGRIGSWDWDAVTDTITWSLEYYRIFGFDPAKPPPGYKEHLSVYTPESAARLDAVVKKNMDTGEPYVLDLEIAHDDSPSRWITARSETKRDADSNIIGLQGTAQDITAYKRAEEEIHRLNQKLEQRVAERTAELEVANKELEAFAYSVSHDLRAPLRHIDGFVELLQKRSGNEIDDQSRHYMNVISDAARKMGILIDDLLSFSRNGRLEMSFREVALEALAHEAIREIEPEAGGKDIDWRIGNLPSVNGDAAMLRMVLVNLISNALKFTRHRQNPRIEIGSAGGREAETVIFIRDNGVGFDMAYADKLFGVFQRLHRTEEFEGTGIGLANVRRIISRHGGRTWAEGQVDGGATFYFTIPYSKKGG